MRLWTVKLDRNFLSKHCVLNQTFSKQAIHASVSRRLLQAWDADAPPVGHPERTEKRQLPSSTGRTAFGLRRVGVKRRSRVGR